MTLDPFTLWHPVASEHDLPYRHVYHGQLLGRELAVWRADDDFVNVWENRCLHRGVRLSIGSNDGTELRCQYHGWRYANRSAGCTYIPAHPADAPARTICNRTFPSVERYGLVWSGEDPVGEPSTIDLLEAGTPFGLRNLPVDAPVALTIQYLQAHRFGPSGQLDAESAEMSVDWADDHSVALTARAGGSRSCAVNAAYQFGIQSGGAQSCRRTPPRRAQLSPLRHRARRALRILPGRRLSGGRAWGRRARRVARRRRCHRSRRAPPHGPRRRGRESHAAAGHARKARCREASGP